jgi:integrase/recombinase XerD
MLEDLFRRPRVQRRIRQNPHGSVLEQFAEYLNARGHSPNTVHQYIFAAEHFCRWLGRRKISRHAVTQFIRRHLTSCRCKTPAPRTSANVYAALNRLLEMIGASASAPARKSAVDSLLQRYAVHLKQVQGLAAATVHYRLRYARTMLSRFRVRRIAQLKHWTVKGIRRFVANQGRCCQPSSGQVIASSIRSFLRFLLLNRLIDQDLAAAVPAFANWRLASLPATVSGEELDHLVRAIDPSSPVGMRDRAIVLCLAELGLRASDVAGLELDGLDLTTDVLRLKRQKQREVTAMPISRHLAEAIGDYVRCGRPACSTSFLFVLHRAPRGKALTPLGVHGVVVRRAAEAGLTDRIRGTHVIRHSVASRWIRAGATLKQVADLLGHRSIDTTSIYAKVDLRALALVALPWPSEREVAP